MSDSRCVELLGHTETCEGLQVPKVFCKTWHVYSGQLNTKELKMKKSKKKKVAPVKKALDSNALMIDVNGVATLLSCSVRHVTRLADAGRMPVPIKLGSLRRWQRAVIDQWILDGCPAIRRRAK